MLNLYPRSLCGQKLQPRNKSRRSNCLVFAGHMMFPLKDCAETCGVAGKLRCAVCSLGMCVVTSPN